MSFKLKLVAYFLLVSLLPLGAAAWGLHTIARRSEARRVDVRLQAGLRAVLASYKDELGRAGTKAETLGESSRFQRALQRRDRRTLRRLLSSSPDLQLHSRFLTLGPARTIGPATVVSVKAPSGRLLGRLVAGVPLSASSVATFRDRTGLSPDDTLVVVVDGTVVVGPAGLRGARLAPPLHARTLDVGGHRYRTLATSPEVRRSSTALALLSPQSKIDNPVAAADKRLLLGILGSLVLIGLVAYIVGGSIVVTLGRL